MTPFRFLLLAIALLVCAPAPAQPGDSDWLYRGSDIERDPAWRFGTLDNGVRFAVRRNPRPEGQVSIRLRIDAGALNERDEERGFAHFVEHMLFRGTRSYPDREARHIWQQLGASFGSDTNATTSATQTVYQLDLPRADRAGLDTSLRVLAEMMTSARFDPALVEAERRVVLAERARRPELTARMDELSRSLLLRGLLIERRDTIGTEETLAAATADGLRAFYSRWYRPERATLVMVGDTDPETMVSLIADHFGGWRAEGPPPPEPDLGEIAEPEARAATLVYPGAPTTAGMAWIRPYEPLPHTTARERLFLAEGLAARILNRRLEAHARDESAFTGAAVGVSRSRGAANITQLSVTARDRRWREALEESFAILSDAVAAPPSQAEIERELQNLRSNIVSAVEGEDTALSQLRAQQLVGAIDSGAVVASARTVLDNFDSNAAHMTAERVGEAMRALFAGSGPRMILLTPEEMPQAAAEEALVAAERAAPAVRRAERAVTMDDLPAFGQPGREVSRERIEDMDVTIVRFDNGSTLTFKPTRFERGSVQVRLRFGRGMSGIPAEGPSLAWLSGLVVPSGLADLDLDALERLLTGRRMMMSFSVAEDAFVLAGQTNAAELGDQLRLLAAKLAAPRWDAALFARFQASALDSFDLQFASASARASRELSGIARPADARWRPVEREQIASTTVADFEAFFAPRLAAGPVHAVVVGDVDLDAAIEAMRTTVAALPARPAPPAPPGADQVRPPASDPRPAAFTHQGDPDQAYALIGWSTTGGIERIRDRRALGLAANMLQVRLFDRLREEEGATYSPAASHSSSETFPDWGIFYAGAEIRPESADSFFAIAREIVADLAANPALPDEFARAQNPVVSGIERRLETNAYWISAIDNWHEEPRSIENVRTFLPDMRALTAEEVRAAVERHVADSGDWSMLVLPARGRNGAE